MLLRLPPDLRRDGLQSFHPARRKHHVASFLREQTRRILSKPGRGTCDQNNFSLQ